MKDGTDIQSTFEVAESPLHLGKGFVVANGLGGTGLLLVEIGAQHIDPVQRGLLVDDLLFARPGVSALGYFQGKIARDLESAQDPIRLLADRVAVSKRSRLHLVSHLFEPAFRHGQQFPATAMLILDQKRIATHHQPLARKIRRGDFSEIPFVEKGWPGFLLGQMANGRMTQSRDPLGARIVNARRALCNCHEHLKL